MWYTNGELEFKHFIVDRQGTVFASARDADNRIYNFLITAGAVKEQRNTHFELLNGEYAEYIKQRAQGYYGIVPTYKIPYIDAS
jgi:hypothetical protein